MGSVLVYLVAITKYTVLNGRNGIEKFIFSHLWSLEVQDQVLTGLLSSDVSLVPAD